jgi:sugar/nucleoside kinase (ribokinase family)
LDLLTVGEAFEDIVFAGLPHLPRLSEELRVDTISAHPGGGAIITAIAARRLGVRAGTITAVSEANIRALRAEHVSLVNLRRPDEHGALTVVLSTPHDRAFVTYEGVNRSLEPRLLEALDRLRRAPRHVHFALVPRQAGAWVRLVEQLQRRGTTTSWDFGWHAELLKDPAMPRLLAGLDWVFVNEREATFYAGARTLRRAMLEWRSLARAAVIKLGARGVVVVNARGELAVRTRRVKVADTTGAGDSFNAGFLAAVLAGAPLAAAARLGNYVGGRSVRATGGIDGLPFREQLPAWARRLLDRS